MVASDHPPFRLGCVGAEPLLVISHEYKCIFIHIPKCAGTSIEAALGHHDGKYLTGQVDHRSIRMIQRPGLCLSSFANSENVVELLRRGVYRFRSQQNPRNRLTVTPEQYRDYFKFAIVRNPWARSYSWYKNVMRGQLNKAKLGIESDISLHDFLSTFLLRGALRSQLHWLRDFSGRLPLDYIGCVEFLNDDFGRICDRLGAARPELKRIRDGGTPDYRDEFDSVSIRLVADAYAEEIFLFGYSFEEPAPSKYPFSHL